VLRWQVLEQVEQEVVLVVLGVVLVVLGVLVEVLVLVWVQ
jgi:hypothetical protein